MKSISDNARRILSVLQFKANASVPDISRAVGIPCHVLQYELQKLKRSRIIRPWALVDFHRLGWTEYELYFSLTAEGRRKQRALMRYLLEHQHVVWVGELGGEYHFLVTIIARNVQELSHFVDSLAEKFGNIFAERVIVSLVSLYFFAKKYLRLTQAKMVETLCLGDAKEVLQIDDLDRKILSRLCTQEDATHRDIARALGLPRTTVDYRIEQLEKRKAIAAYVCRMNASHFGRTSFRFLIKTSGMGCTERQLIFNFCQRHPDVVSFFHCVGSWDIELTVEVASLPDAGVLMQELYEKFGNSIHMIKTMTIFSSAQSRGLLG